MKKLIRLFVSFLFVISIEKSQAQVTHFSEDFNNGCTQLCLANGYNGWTVSMLGFNGIYCNKWYVSCAENGNLTGTCSSGCGGDATLHLGNDPISPNAPTLCPTGDCGALWDVGVNSGDVTTNQRVESPVINLSCSGNPVTVSFRYFERGSPPIDNFRLDYFDGTTWALLSDPPQTATSCGLTIGLWTLYSISLPASAVGNANVQIGFRWTNGDDGLGNQPSVAIDSVRVTSPAVPPNLSADFSCNTNLCLNDCIDFTDLSVGNNLSWAWDFGGGGNPLTSTAQNPLGVCWNTLGTYDVTLTVTDNCGYTSSQMQQVTVSNCNNLVADFSASDTTICAGTCIDFTDLSTPTGNIIGWSWSFPGATTPNSILQNPTGICYPTAGSYDVKLTVDDGNTTNTLVLYGYVVVTNCVTPSANFSASTTTGCVNDCITFTDLSQNATIWGWGFPGGTPNFFIGQNPPQICYAAAGTYDVAQYVADASGNTDTLIQVGYITITNCNGPTAAFNASATIGCNNDSITFTDASLNATAWSWTFNGGTPSTFIGQNPPPIHYQTPGVYDVLLVVSNANGTDSLLQSAYITINYCGGLLAQFSASDTFICAGECISFLDLSFGNPIGWLWILPGATPDTVTAQSPPYVCYLNAGIFPVTLIAFDSTTADTVTYTNYITVMNGTPVSTNLDSTTIFGGTPIQLIASGGVSYAWDNGNSLDNDSIPSPLATPFDTTVYTVTMYDVNGCTSAKSILINVIPPETVWAPNAFTPNNDQNNDIFYIRPGGIIINYELRIFDRWGEMLFQSKDPTAGWDGTYLNTKLNVGVYVYYYKIEFIDGVVLENSGDVTLLR